MLQNDCRLLLRLQGRYVQPAAAMCTDCACSAPVHPGSSVGMAGQVAAVTAAASFEQRCCGCCVNKLQLAGLLPQAATATPAAVPPAAGLAVAEPPPGCCHSASPTAEAAAAGPPLDSATAAAAAPAPAPGGCCGCKEEQEPACQPPSRLQQQLGARASDACPKAPGGSGRRVSAGAACLQGVRLQLPSQQQQEEQEEPLLPGLLHLDIQRHAYTAPRGKLRQLLV